MGRQLDRIISFSTRERYSLFHKRVYIGKGVGIRRGFDIRNGSEGVVTIGDGCFFNRYFSAVAYSRITIGNNCIFGENVKIYDNNHRFNGTGPIKDQGFSIKEVKIGDNVWVGSNAVILKGTVIGSNVVIGAGCVVSGTIGDDCVVKPGGELTVTPIVYADK